jgi:hypothetical protein
VTDGVIKASRASHKIAASTYAISTIFTSVPNITILVPTPSSRITTALATHRFDDLASLARNNTRSKTYLIRTLAGTDWCDRSITHAHFRNAVNHLPTFGTAHQIELLGATLATHMKGHMVSQNKPFEPHLVKQIVLEQVSSPLTWLSATCVQKRVDGSMGKLLVKPKKYSMCLWRDRLLTKR